MYEYSICSVADPEVFNKQCEALEKNIPNLKEKSIFELDVDGHIIKEYEYIGNKIEVHKDLYLNEIYVKSEIELKQFFE